MATTQPKDCHPPEGRVLQLRILELDLTHKTNLWIVWKDKLGQAPVKLDAIIEVIVEVGVEVVNWSLTTILVGGWSDK